MPTDWRCWSILLSDDGNLNPVFNRESMKIWWVKMISRGSMPTTQVYIRSIWSKWLRRNPGTYTTKFELVESFRHHRSRCSYRGSMVCQWHHAPWWWQGGITMNSLKVGEWLTGEDVEIAWNSSWESKWELAGVVFFLPGSHRCVRMYILWPLRICTCSILEKLIQICSPSCFLENHHGRVKPALGSNSIPPFLTQPGGESRDLVGQSLRLLLLQLGLAVPNAAELIEGLKEVHDDCELPDISLPIPVR